MFNKYLIAILIIPLFLGAQCQVSQKNNNDSPTPLSPAGSSGASLNLSNQGLTSLPSYVLSRTNLKELNISYNNLTGALPAEIRQLKNLEVLNASYNQMTGVPAEVGQLSKLKVLDLSYNQLTGLPYELGNLKNLETLNLSGNQYSELDLGIIEGQLPNTTIIK